ncbi:MAG TPA: ferredoxin [Nanoarchaeota archaeon]|nr:ferredoxin [Nanoarchaeota archaeon]
MANKVVHDIDICISCGACAAVADKLWEMDTKTGKAVLKGGKLIEGEGNKTEKDFEDADMPDFKASADSCPVNCIHIFDKAGKKII